MKKVNFFLIVTLLFELFVETVNAEVKLPAIVSSNMVLQRNTTVVLWGWADAGEKISITTSWLKEKINLQADKAGNWRIDLKTTNSLESQTISFKSNTSDIKLENVLFGEVWLCSGQSNMLRSIRGKLGEPTFGSVMETAKANNPNLRLFDVGFASSKTPLNELKKFQAWQAATPINVTNYSAIAYYFGNQLQEILGCPVGIIHSSVGGSAVETWMSKAAINEFQKINIDTIDIEKNATKTPTVLFNAMINPLIPFTIKGVLWYQGEANLKDPANYKKLFPAMVNDWRTRWNIGEFPFFYVQIAPFGSGNKAFQTTNNAAFIREAQLQCLDLIPNSGMAVTLDIGDGNTIHPPKKKEVAERLLFIALNKAYGYTTIDCDPPVYDSFEVKDGGFILSFKNADLGLYTYDKLTDFEIAGNDKVFYAAEAKIINKKTVFVSSPKVPNPEAVRYGWKSYVHGTLLGINLIPASSFRTDNWDDATRAEE